MGPETEKRAPSAKKSKDKLWRSFAALVVVASAIVYNEDDHTINRDYSKVLPNDGYPSPTDYFESLPSKQALEHLISGSFSLSELLANPQEMIEVQIADEDTAEIFSDQVQSPIPSEEVEKSGESNSPIAPKPAHSPNVGEGEIVPITGYYCQQVPGYYIGDGGGYCGNTASGEPVRPGVAACGRKWPLGTKLFIEGYGQVVCLDRGHLGQNQIDVFFPTNKDLAESDLPSRAKVIEVKD